MGEDSQHGTNQHTNAKDHVPTQESLLLFVVNPNGIRIVTHFEGFLVMGMIIIYDDEAKREMGQRMEEGQSSLGFVKSQSTK